MGRSRRRAARTKQKVSLKPKRKPLTKAAPPLEITDGRPSLAEKLGTSAHWDAAKTFTRNYEEIGFVSNPNSGFGRNVRHSDPIQEKAAEIEETGEEVESADDMRVALGKVRKSGKAPPEKLTTHQNQIMARLVAAHGDDVEAMAKDRKLNTMLHPPGRLKRMLQAYQAFSQTAGGRCRFRVPNKRLW
ncbi:hypothetical protein WJX72_011665 [[Myrmecia] bisecta]|uniref:Nucleolar protein 16 n=1 Tax=[Myrmecia] bisecta TaxID=41462 RepID=A0AAW1PUR8_9CHLO